MFYRPTRSVIGHATLALVAVAALWLTGCNDDPTGIGSGYLPENVQFASYRVSASEVETFSGIASISNSTSRGATAILVGRAADGSVAHGLMVVTDSLRRVEGTNPQTVESVTLRLRSYGYRFGDLANAQASFDVISLDDVALDTLKWSPALASRIDAAPSLGTYTGAYSDSGVVDIELDKVAATNFLRSYYRYDTTVTLSGSKPDTTIVRTVVKSLGLRARAGSQTIVSFLGGTYAGIADSLKPALRVRFADSTIALRFGVSSWVADLPVDFGPGKLMLAGGEPVRSFIGIHPRNLPAGATIHQARLLLHVDPSRTRSGSTGTTTVVLLMDASSTARDAATYLLPVRGGRFLYGYRIVKDTSSYTDTFSATGLGASITSAIRRAASGGDSTASFVLALNRSLSSYPDLEAGTVDRVGFYGFDAADTAVRPELTIIYSVQKNVP